MLVSTPQFRVGGIFILRKMRNYFVILIHIFFLPHFALSLSLWFIAHRKRNAPAVYDFRVLDVISVNRFSVDRDFFDINVFTVLIRRFNR